jgi:alanyl-tRNA synthetase
MRHNRRVSFTSSDEIREGFLGFFEARDHRRLPSGSLVPATFDPSVLLTTAGMHPLKPYFSGLEQPPHHRLTTCQKCFRSTDIENVGATARHLTFFEMLGNFSIGDYFKQGAVELAWELSLEGFGFDPQDIWITVFEGDPELGLGPDEEAIAAWESVGVPRERIILLAREDNFWQSGPTGPCGPCSELYLDRGLEWGAPDDLPGGENERFLEYWNLVFMQYDQDPINELTPLPAQNIDTGLGLNRMALIQQGVPTIFETDQFAPLMRLGRELATAPTPDERALRILADHARAMTFLIADGVVPSNEDRGYILRRVMRRAIQQGHRIGIEERFLAPLVEQVIETMGAGYPELISRRDTILKWVRSEEEGFGRTLEQGTRLLDQLLAEGELSPADAFRLHDTFGFPIELTREIAAERGVPFTGDEEFARLMDEQRARSVAAGGRSAVAGSADVVRAIAPEPTAFTGYEQLEQHTTVAGVLERDGRTFVKLAESPFYAEGGGQVSDAGTIACADRTTGFAGGAPCLARVVQVVRAGDDQAVVVEPEAGRLEPGERVVARVDPIARHATECNHTATHLLHAALRELLGDHVHQAGSYVGPDKLRFDFSHTQRLSEDERRRVEDRVNEWILRNDRVRPITTTLDEAQRLGAMALFGEKYGDVVRMVEIADGSYSRELCGGTHVRSTAEIGLFVLISEGSSASNVRRIEALTGPEAVRHVRFHDRVLHEAAGMLRAHTEAVPAAIGALQQKAREAAKAGTANGAVDVSSLVSRAGQVDGAVVLAEVVDAPDAKALLDLADRVKGKLGESAAVVLGCAVDGRVHLVASVAPALVQRGVKAGAIVREAAQVAGGGGGGRDTMAQAGGRDPEKLAEAIAAARAAIEAALA